MALKFGISNLQNQFSSLNNSPESGFYTQNFNNIRAVRVLSIVLDETHPRFKELGEWNALGIIEYEDVINPLPSNINPVASPLMGNNKIFPLINEIVYILSLPNTDLAKISSNTEIYYINIVSLWNHPHHNAFPTTPDVLPSTQQKDYVQTELGSIRRITDQSTEIFLGKTFKERSNIHPLLPFEGDTIYEGRWGNSIRIGSTVKNTPNNWSTTGSNGDPILIIRNGQGNQTDEGWIPVIEDINNNDSSIYITSTQKIPLEASSINYSSYSSNPPKNPNQYAGKQIIITSGRLIFNTTQDHILLSSNKSINLNAVNSVNIDTNQTTIQSNNVYLGSKNATEPLLLGNQTLNVLNTLLDNLTSFMIICSTLVAPDGHTAPLNAAAQQFIPVLNNLKTTVNLQQGGIRSTQNFTI